MFKKNKMLSKIFGAIIGGSILCCSMYIGHAQTSISTQSFPEIGIWATKAEDGVFQIYQCGQNLCGKFVGMRYKGANPPVSNKGTSQCGFPMLRNFVRQDKSKYWIGKIADPRNEKIYDAKIWLENNNELKLRGYLGISLFGETKVWHRYNHKIGTSCRIK